MEDTTRGDYPPRPLAWRSAIIVFVLTAIALADRMAISMLIGPIKAEFGLGDFEASLLIGFAFTLFYVIFLLPIGAAADRFSRAKVLGMCLFVWSITTVACGFATGFVSLFVLRMLMGAGEAGIGPCSHGIIGASFPRERLSKPLALQGIGFQVGPAAGVAAAGAILAAGAAGAFDGIPLLADLAPWRVAFILIGLPGLLALLLIPLLHDPDAHRRTTADMVRPSVWPFVRQHRLLMGLMLLGSGISAMASGVVTGWVPEYLQRVLGASPAEAGSMLGAIMLATAFIGQGIYAAIVDWFAARGVLDAPIRVGLLPTALAVPLAWLAFGADGSAAFYPLLFAFALVIAPFNAVNNTVAQMLAPPALRSRVSALFIFSISIIGFAIGPALVGWLSEYVFGEARLGEAMRLVATLAMAVTFVLFWLARKPLLRVMQAKTAA
ncbi:MFS transporter [Erythrobacter arachoides]|uniref:MFS transporter n=1 Tax=Aurantiacibacter arachoides TaxID=1850444 RepID=A0A845A0E9_9SPHN|nr:MFS transporter [Aurantiacibacter arachoides]MXO92616.1 MFS transporter [Aurantiacibacter arachoides]GGD55759.1 MFS transporter [Aurantiacibacter arachoides]